jgi:CDP-diacylglycerol--serine O-phosphatidyltransferase
MISLLSVADIISLLNANLGFLSVIMAFSGQIRLAFSFILLALLADGLDGIVARKTKHGVLGENFEAMADMISMGIAPLVFVYAAFQSEISSCVYFQIYFYVTVILFISLSAIRLSSFHVLKDKKFFIGLPASAGTIVILVTSLLKITYIAEIVILILVALFMISPIKFPKIGLKINSTAAVLIILTIIFEQSFNNILPIILLIAILTYVIGGPIYLLIKSKE